MTVTRRSWLVLAAALAWLLSCAPVPPGSQGVVQAQASSTPTATETPLVPTVQPKPLADMWLDVSMGQPLIAWFNQTARPGDIARADHVALLNLLDEVKVGQRLVVFKSAAQAREALPFVADRMDILGYNLEHGPANPLNEQADPLGGVKAMRELANKYGLKLAMGPDHDFAVEVGPSLAPYVDIFVLQIQRVQTDPETVQAFVLPLVEDLRAANPNIQISVQVRTEGDVGQMADLLQSISGSIDGVSILTSPETVDVAKDLVRELRSRTTVPSPTPTVTPLSMQIAPRAYAAELPTVLPPATVTARVQKPTPSPTAAATPTSSPSPAQAGAPTPTSLAQAAVSASQSTPVGSASATPALIPSGLRRLLLPLAGAMAAAALLAALFGAAALLWTRRSR